ncbi:MAG: hypothetical protein KKE17_07070 [Proteobacteria bacterium]|nr:hypothetical protein [Pseudomonadota bacterium]MBU1709748.1 hypothetical protein [Pseudomonadota bacterium]
MSNQSFLPFVPPEHIGFDIDGVVADTMEAFIRLARHDYDITVEPEKITAFIVEDCLPMDPVIIDEIFTRLMNAPIEAGLRPMPHAVEVLQELSTHAPLSFVTARPLKEPVHDWLINVLGEKTCKDMRLEATGEHDGKTECIKEMNLRYFIDDRAETCLMLKEEGIMPFVYEQPWNRGRKQLRYIFNWHDVRDMCLAQSFPGP